MTRGPRMSHTEVRAIKELDLRREQKAADLIGKALLEAARDEKQFKRYIVTEKQGNESITEERIFDKLDLKAVQDMIKSLSMLEELKRSLLSNPDEKEDEQADTFGIVLLPPVANNAE